VETRKSPLPSDAEGGDHLTFHRPAGNGATRPCEGTEKTGGEVLSVYAHLSALEVEAGEAVDGRQVIARSGQSGNAASPHLHFEIWRWGREVDPVPLLGGFPGP
jgi:acyl-homoserine lactone acylase PvdQ